MHTELPFLLPTSMRRGPCVANRQRRHSMRYSELDDQVRNLLEGVYDGSMTYGEPAQAWRLRPGDVQCGSMAR